MNDFFSQVHAALMQVEPDAKCAQTTHLAEEWRKGVFTLSTDETVAPIGDAGRPARPELVAPQAAPRRALSQPEGRAALIHSLTHIEFNAINLALDAAYRFRGLPHDFYGDWLQVAAEEAQHFHLLRDHLRSLGYDYGDFAAHNGLWDMALRTAHDPLVRMALVPRLLEARGLDVTPGLRHKLHSTGDTTAARILEIIEGDEVGHVVIGNRWYDYFCTLRELEPVETFQQLLAQYDAPDFGPPFNGAARRAAGFSEREIALLGLRQRAKGRLQGL